MPEQSLASQTACFHCGDPCGPRSVNDGGERAFCCVGCRAVYSLLREHNLAGYYERDVSPGSKPRFGSSVADFAYLDDAEITATLIRSVGGSTARVSLRLPQIHCASCIWLLERLPQLEDGVKRAEVDFPRKTLSVIYEQQQITLRQLVERLAELGYEPQIHLGGSNDSTGDSSRLSRRRLYLRLGIAGFAFGNIMLFSFPEYLSGGATIQPGIARVFGYASLLLALPVLLYSASDYFAATYRALRERTMNIDIPIALGITALFGRSAYEIISGAGVGYLDSLAGLVFFLLIGRVFQEKAYSALSFENDYRAYFPISALKRTQFGVQPIALEKLNCGDQVIVRNGELIPADGVIKRGAARLDYSFVTGESEPQCATEGEPVYTGGRQTGSAIEVELLRDVSHSYLSDLWRSDSSEKRRAGARETLVNQISTFFTPAVLFAATAAFFYWLPEGISPALNSATAALIVACPCALALTSPFALGAAMRILGSRKIFVKNTHVIERLAALNALVFDKTGTLTRGHSTAEFIGRDGANLDEYQRTLVYSLAAQSTHPLSRQIVRSLRGPLAFEVTDFHERHGEGISAVIDGRSVRLGSRAFVGVADKFAPGARVFCSIDSAVIGGFTLPVVVRAGIRQTLKKLSGFGSLALLSGDNDTDHETMREILGKQANLKFKQKPQDKRKYITNLQSQGQQVMMIGDGLNDAGALAVADVGVAVTDEDSGFSPASDMIVTASGLGKLYETLTLAKYTRIIMYAGFALSLAYNVIGLSFALRGELTPLVAALLMPLSSITVVAFSAGLTTLIGGKTIGAAQ